MKRFFVLTPNSQSSRLYPFTVVDRKDFIPVMSYQTVEEARADAAVLNVMAV